MSIFNENDEPRNDEPMPENFGLAAEQHPESEDTEKAGEPEQEPEPRTVQPPVNEYWVRNNGGTTPYGYAQGYRPPQPPYHQYNPYDPYQGGSYPPNMQNHPPYGQQPGGSYGYGPGMGGGWQQGSAQQSPPNQEQYQWNFKDYDNPANETVGANKQKKKKRGFVIFAAALACVLALSVIGISALGIFGAFNFMNSTETEVTASSEASSEAVTSPAAQIEIASRPEISQSLPIGEKMTTPQVAKAVSPSVVGVVQYQPNMTIAETGEGSGIVMTDDGYIITNAHVVAGGTDFKVILHDGTPIDADLVGADQMTDLAVLKVDSVSGLVPAVFGNSDQIEVGEPVIAIGNPGGKTLAGSVTQGIVSAVDREIPGASNLPINIPLIQTDAAINPGNSGGALVNEYGQVIGINSAKIAAANFEGIGFAIPISEAKPIIDDIVKNGRVTGRVKLGITVRAISESDARQAGVQAGLRIEAIEDESDLLKKGVQKFDIITHIDGERIYTVNEMKGIFDKRKPGESVTLTLFRPLGASSNNTYEVTVILMEDVG